MANSIVASSATTKTAQMCACGEIELFCWCDAVRQREAFLKAHPDRNDQGQPVTVAGIMNEYGAVNVRTRADGAVFANGVTLCFSSEVKALLGGAA